MKKKFLDRKDGKRVKDTTGMSQILIDLKPNRCDSDVYINQKIDVTELVKYVEKKKKEGMEITYFHAFITALAKVIYNRPKLNRFVQNRHIYEHNDVVIGFVAKISFDDKSEELMLLVPFKENDTIETSSKIIKEKVDRLRNKRIKNDKKKEGANDAIDTLGKLPNIIRVPLLGLFKWLDAHDMLPATLIKDNLYYSSMIVSNLGSIGCGAIYHNLTNLGTASSLTTIGEIKDEPMIINEKITTRKTVEFGINLDERIADGYYMAKASKLLEYILQHPEMLEEKVSTKIEIPKSEKNKNHN